MLHRFKGACSDPPTALQSLEAKAKTQKFKQPLNSQFFAYHIG